jgi:hypothetical protein
VFHYIAGGSVIGRETGPGGVKGILVAGGFAIIAVILNIISNDRGGLPMTKNPKYWNKRIELETVRFNGLHIRSIMSKIVMFGYSVAAGMVGNLLLPAQLYFFDAFVVGPKRRKPFCYVPFF